ncbi:MAG: YggS family pyridoxal phosphate-dependent enzyme, partial [Pseudomonadota bacterium]
DDLDAFVKECRGMDLQIAGLMCLPPVEEEAALHFALLAKLAERNGLTGLSMGMSADFEKAIAFGATHIRVGSAIFGERVKPA